MEELLGQLSFTPGNTESQNLSGTDFMLSLSLPESILASHPSTCIHARARAHTHTRCVQWWLQLKVLPGQTPLC